MVVPVFNYKLLELIEGKIKLEGKYDFSYTGICLFIQDNYEEIRKLMEGE